MFILAAAGSAVGLGNIWRFPYLAGENGGGVFVLVYLACIALIGLPILIAEILMGRAGRQNPITTMKLLASESNASQFWQVIGWMGAIAGFMILSFYGVIAGWAMAYVGDTATGDFVGISGAAASQVFNQFISDPVRVIGWQTVFMLITVSIAARGVSQGLENTVRYLMPLLFLLLVTLVGYSALTTGHFVEGFPLCSRQTGSDSAGECHHGNGASFLHAQPRYGCNHGLRRIYAVGSSVVGTATTIAVLDTSVALMSGLVIFPLVFANGLESAAGPGLMFITLPIAFGQMAGGQIFGTLFFVLVTFAAVTSSISLLEPAVAWVGERLKLSRAKAASLVGAIDWSVGLGNSDSLNFRKDVTLTNVWNFFDLMYQISNKLCYCP